MERQRRYPSDLTDAQWEIVEPMLPLIKSPGRIPKHPAGPSWTPSCTWCAAAAPGVSCRSTSRPGRRCTGSSSSGRNARSPNASSKSCASGYAWPKAGNRSRPRASSTRRASRPRIPSGATRAATTPGKRINGRKRFIVTDTLGLLVVVCVMAASWQDRDGAKTTLLSAYMATPIRCAFTRILYGNLRAKSGPSSLKRRVGRAFAVRFEYRRLPFRVLA